LTLECARDNNTPTYLLPSWGFDVKYIRALGRCPKCKGTFKPAKPLDFECPQCLTHPRRYMVEFPHEGRRIRRVKDLGGKTLRTFGDAHALCVQLQREAERPDFNIEKWQSKKPIEYRFSKLIGKWYDEKAALMQKGKRAPSYVPKLRTYIERFYIPAFGTLDVRGILSLKDFINGLPDNLSPKYQKNIRDALRGFFRWLRDEERVIDALPYVPTVEVPEYEFKIIRPETQAAILGHVPDEHKPIFIYLFNQGCRPSEARALKWKDIEGDTVTYRRTWSAQSLMERTKTKKARHNLLFPETAAALPRRGFGEDFVFTHGKGKRPYGDNLLHRIWRAALDSFNEAMSKEHPRWEPVHIKLYEATKHSFGTRYAKKVGSKLMQKWFGHTSENMTDRYVKIEVVDEFRAMVEREAKVARIENASNRPAKGD
jgi:integrase